MPCKSTFCRIFPSGGYENDLTAIDVFSRYLFAYPLTDASAINVAKALNDIMTKHANLPTTIITDKGTAFTSTIIAEVTQILGITLKYATTKPPQTIGKLERTHASLKTNLKMACGEYRRQRHKYLPLAVLNHNTSYHASIGCEPTRVFHGRIPYNILDQKLGNNPNERISPTTETAEEIQNRTKILIDKTKQNIMQSYIKYKEYYDRKAKAAPLKENEYCFVLQPKADNQGSKIPFRDYRWVGPFVVKKVLPNENYIVRRINTNKTRILHRIRLKKFVPNQPLEDSFREQRLQPDEEIVIPQDNLYIITWKTDFGEQLVTRGNEPIPTSLPNGEQPSAAETNPNDVDENEADYIITREGFTNDNTAHSRNERLSDYVTKRNEATTVTENENSDWPNPAVSPKNQEKPCRIRQMNRKLMKFFQKEIRWMKTIHKTLQIGGMTLSCPKYLKTMLEMKVWALEEGNIFSGLTPTQTTQKTSDTRKDWIQFRRQVLNCLFFSFIFFSPIQRYLLNK